MRSVARHSRPLPLQAAAAISFVRALGTNQASTGDSLSITLTSDVQVGDTVIISFAMNPRTTGPNDVSCSDSRGNTWTVDGDVIRGSGIDGVRSVTCSTRVSAAMASGDSITVHHPSNADERAMSASEFSGLRSNGLDRSATGVGIDTATPLTMATAATTIPNEPVIGTIGVEGPPVAPDTFTPGNGFTALDRAGTLGGGPAGNISVNAEYRIVTDVGQYVADATLGVARDWAAIVATYESACGNGVVDPGEECDDGNSVAGDCCSPACTFEPATTVCRPSAGACDVAETCTGSSGTCPPDAKSTAVCRPSRGGCDGAEVCDGVSNDCPPDDLPANAGTVCRPAVGVCDVDDLCDGVHPTCPPDAKSTAVCRPAAGACDLAESCDGVSNDCPPDVLAPATTTCRGAAAFCDAAENCTGTSVDCPPDVKKPATVLCRSAAGPCDVAENCDGQHDTARRTCS